VTSVKDEADRVQRKAARGRDDATPALVHHVLFLIIGAFVALVVGIVLLLYYVL
jgi:hypothetical protein